MERQIASNNFKVALLVGAAVCMFTAFAVAIAWGFDSWYGFLIPILGIAYMIYGYSSSTKSIITLAHAKPVTRSSHRALYNIADNLSITAGIKTPQVYVIPDPSLNAFAAGATINQSIIGVTQGLLETLNRQELEGVMAHEISHIVNRDVRLSVLLFVLVGAMALMLNMMRFGGGGGRGRGGGYGFLLALAIGIPFYILTIFAKYAVSRKREYLADVSGAQLTRYPKGLASALQKIQLHGSSLKQAKKEVSHLFLSNPLKKKSFFGAFRTHPPLEDRIARLNAMEDAGY